MVSYQSQIPSPLPGPINGPTVWYGSQMSQSTEWVLKLDGAEIAEIAAAVKPLVAADADIAQLTASQFPLPRLGLRLAGLRDGLIHGRGFSLLRGLPVHEWSVREAATAFFGIGTHLGNARPQNGLGHLLGHVCDLGRDAENDPNARIYQTRERQTFHTDSCDAVGLLCLKTAQSGGASALVSSHTIYNEMLKRRPDLLPPLFESIQTDRRGEVPAGALPWHDIPVFSWYEGHLSALYARRYIESARRFEEVPPLTPLQIEALDFFDMLANDPDIGMQMTFQPGDMQWVHNHTMLHDRTAYIDWPDLAERRHLLRLWLAIPGARPLPPVYAQRFGKVTIGDRGGIEVPGMKTHAPLEAE